MYNHSFIDKLKLSLFFDTDIKGNGMVLTEKDFLKLYEG
jgi:hypothetical protein